jgi:hypothetical protein
MANVTIAGGATNLPVASTIDGAADYLPIYTASALATQAINRNTLLGITSGPAGLTDTQALTNKTIGNTNTLTVKDGSFTLQSTADTTKQAKFSLTSITTGNTRTFTLPDLSDTVVTLTATQTLTNKTLTSATINTPTITNATISADALTGFTVSNTGTVYGISVSTGVITTAGSVGSGANVTNGVQAAALATNAITLGVASITSNFTTTTAGSFVNVTGLSVTVTVPAGGRRVKITVQLGSLASSQSAGNGVTLDVYDSTAAAEIGSTSFTTAVANYSQAGLVVATHTPAAGSRTYIARVQEAAAGTVTVSASSTAPSFILVEAI